MPVFPHDQRGERDEHEARERRLRPLSWQPFSDYALGKHLEQETRFIRSAIHLGRRYRLTANGEQARRVWAAYPYPSHRIGPNSGTEAAEP